MGSSEGACVAPATVCEHEIAATGHRLRRCADRISGLRPQACFSLRFAIARTAARREHPCLRNPRPTRRAWFRCERRIDSNSKHSTRKSWKTFRVQGRGLHHYNSIEEGVGHEQ